MDPDLLHVSPVDTNGLQCLGSLARNVVVQAKYFLSSYCIGIVYDLCAPTVIPALR